MPDLRNHVIVCGLGDIGLRVVEQLCLAGEQVVVLDDTDDARRLRDGERFGATIEREDARRSGALDAAGIVDAAALICADESELANLEIALLAKRLHPDLRVVAQLSNESVGRAVERVTGAGTVLDAATIAAPTLAESCLDVDRSALDLDGTQFVLQGLTATHDGTLRQLYGDLAPIAVVPADGGEMAVCPGRDLPVVAGDEVVVISPAAAEPGVAIATGDVAHRVRRRPLRRFLSGFLASSESQFKTTLQLLLAVAVVSVVVLRLAYRTEDGGRMSVLDAAYFTTETLTTVGFGDFNFASQHVWLRLWAIALMIIGATLVTVLYAMITNLLISRRIAATFGRQLATRMSDHVVVVGLGSVGLRVVEWLVRAGQPVVVLERDEENRYLTRARALDVPVVFGDSTVPASLDAVNLHRARAVAVLTSSDLANIETGLGIDELLGERRADVPVVLRVFDRELAETVGDGFGFHYVRSTSALAAPWFVGAALGLRILKTFYVDQQPMLVGRLTVADHGGLDGSTMAELSARIRVVAIRRRGAAAIEYPPRRDTRFAGGDQAYLAGPYEELLRVMRRDQVAAR